MLMNTTMTTRGSGTPGDGRWPKSGVTGAIVVLVVVAAPGLVLAQAQRTEASSSEPRPQPNLRRYVPDTVSQGWRRIFEALPDPALVDPWPGPDDVEGWKQAYNAAEQRALTGAEEAVKRYQVSIASRNLGGVPVLEITPKGWVDNGKLLVYTHGGAYTMYSARSTLPGSALVADRTGLRVISVDYTNPPRARWQAVTDEVVTVWPRVLSRKD